MLTKEMRAVREAARVARRVLAITGAGVSAESGIPTFRDADGWWNTRRPDELATLEAFRADPAEVWRWYESRREQLAASEPNAAHKALARCVTEHRSVSIVTQNVDDLHERAGSREVVHVHGSIWRLRCMAEGRVYEDRRVPLPELPPRCKCGGLARPDIVWWDEELDPAVVAAAEALVNAKPDVVFVVGTEATFEYIREWARRARAGGALLVEVNTGRTVLSPSVDVHLEGRAGELMNAVLA